MYFHKSHEFLHKYCSGISNVLLGGNKWLMLWRNTTLMVLTNCVIHSVYGNISPLYWIDSPDASQCTLFYLYSWRLFLLPQTCIRIRILFCNAERWDNFLYNGAWRFVSRILCCCEVLMNFTSCIIFWYVFLLHDYPLSLCKSSNCQRIRKYLVFLSDKHKTGVSVIVVS